MKWAHKDEVFTWREDYGTHPSTRKTYPEFYARIPDALHARLVAVWAELEKVADEINACAGKDKD